MSAHSRHSPKLSFVVVSRNDDHGGNLLKRMQLFVSGLLEQCKRHKLQSELILVEWNPPGDRPGLDQALSWPSSQGYCQVRIVQVPARIHQEYKHAEGLPVFQMIGKNVGIRRARGEFILATNVDILFSHELFDFLASARLDEGKVYRIDRSDAPEDIPEQAALDEQLGYCLNHLIRVNAREGIYPVSSSGEIMVEQAPPVIPKHLLQVLSQPKKLLKLPRWVWLVFRDYIPARVMHSYDLHINACGDFTLLSKKDWFSLRGYCEYEMYSMHLDSLMCHAAGVAGMEEVVLEPPMRLFHIEHSLGSGWQPGVGGDLLYQRLHEAGIPAWTIRQLMQRVLWMRLRKNPLLYNPNQDWGLAGLELSESIIDACPENGASKADIPSGGAYPSPASYGSRRL